MKSIVAITKLRRDIKQELFWKVKKAMELSNWKEYVRPGKIFIKADYGYDKIVPGMCTSPWVLESIIKIIRETMPHAIITIGDRSASSNGNIFRTYKRWGIDKIAKQHNITIVDLSKEKHSKAADPFDKYGKGKKTIKIPTCIFEADSVINVPVIRKDYAVGIACSLKNNLSCLPHEKGSYLPGKKNILKGSIEKKIYAANMIIKSDFIIADATICMEDNGTLNGIPSVKNMIIAGNDAVSVDSAACKMLGIDPKTVKYISDCERAKIGNLEYIQKGATIQKDAYFIATKNKRERYAKSKLPSWIIARYNSSFWHKLYGQHYTRDIVKRNSLYGQEFGELIKLNR